jgi:hypothetical protein
MKRIKLNVDKRTECNLSPSNVYTRTIVPEINRLKDHFCAFDLLYFDLIEKELTDCLDDILHLLCDSPHKRVVFLEGDDPSAFMRGQISEDVFKGNGESGTSVTVLVSCHIDGEIKEPVIKIRIIYTIE